jgi:hypothetical protein
MDPVCVHASDDHIRCGTKRSKLTLSPTPKKQPLDELGGFTRVQRHRLATTASRFPFAVGDAVGG